ncbi:MAG: hypothetical protein JXB50_12170 [Spirochaetes bacterium]|nr:hypothetical protein [Spirochaetota bacterium]
MLIDFTHDELKRLQEYIEFMAEFDDDPDLRKDADSALEKIEDALNSKIWSK